MFVAGLGPAQHPPSPAFPPPPDSDPPGQPPPPPPPPDAFASLLAALRKAIVPKKGFHVWDNSRGANNDFHVILVDKNVRFPPLKARPPSTQQQPPAPLHSPISPLSPSSPLYPDGIMAPIWIRKHREMVPAVFILVLRLGEYASAGGPLDQSKKEDDERLRDADLVRDIVDRKRSTVERGIKLAVILVCSRQLLDDPSLDSRLSLIRRQSGLDSRASLFVISPVPQSEVANFVLSFHGELYPSALDYYREHGRRVRRKRARQVQKGKLSDKGWSVRYDYKMGVFSEMRGETEVSLKHYEDSYDTLVEMFSVQGLLLPRTKRWAEAKVLADCLTVKICKSYLYLNEPSRAVAQLNGHIARFRELSNTWGIGEQTFEFWSWLSKQYRLFADLVAIAVRAGFRLPSLRPPPTPRSVPAGMPQPASPSLVPATVLQHAGYYFYMAGLCSVRRRDCFRLLASTEPEEGVPVSPAVAHETKVDHAEIIIDLYTKAYEYFKVSKTSRQSLFIASQIALAHFQAGNHEMALKFNERISRTYRREKWRDILDAILEMSYASAVKIGDYETAIRTVFGLLAPDSRITLDARSRYAAELLEILHSQTPVSPEKGTLTVDMSEVAPLFDCRIVFWQPSANIGDAVPFQITLASPPGSTSAGLAFSSVAFQFSDGRAPVVVRGTDSSEDGEGVCRLGALGEATGVRSGAEEATGKLSWPDGAAKVFSGTIAGGSESALTLESATLTLSEGDWTINLVMRPEVGLGEPAFWRVGSAVPATTIQLLQPNPAVCSVQPRNLRIEASITHDSPAYLDEQFEIVVEVRNDDEVEVEVFLDILLQPGEEDSRNQVLIDDQVSSSIITAVSLGLLAPSTSLSKTFHLLSLGSPGERQLDVSIRSQPTLLGTSSLPTSASATSVPSSTEVLRTLTIQAVPPLFSAFDTHFYRRRRAGKHLLDFEEPDGWESASDVTVVAKLCAAGPWALEVVGIRLACEEAPDVRVVHGSVDGNAPQSFVWRPHDFFNVIYRVEVMVAVSDEDAKVPSRPVLEVLWRRKSSTSSPTLTRLPLSILPLPLSATISVRLPPYMTVHTPTTLSYRLSNPTDRLLSLALQVDSSDGFVFAGPRKSPTLILAPSEERVVDLVVVPLVVGPSVVPRVRVFELERGVPTSPTSTSGGGQRPEEEDGAPKAKELAVVEEADVDQVRDPRQAHLEMDLWAARGGAAERGEEGEGGGDAEGPSRAFVVVVLPPATTEV